jgi:hypothetical protein
VALICDSSFPGLDVAGTDWQEKGDVRDFKAEKVKEHVLLPSMRMNLQSAAHSPAFL